MNIKLDENLGETAAQVLRTAGHDVMTVRQQQLEGTADRELAQICAAEGRCLVTLDLDFSNPIVFPPARYAGIAVLRLPPRPEPSDLTDAVATLVQALVDRDITGKLWSVQRGLVREYQPPEATP